MPGFGNASSTIPPLTYSANGRITWRYSLRRDDLDYVVADAFCERFDGDAAAIALGEKRPRSYAQGWGAKGRDRGQVRSIMLGLS